MKRQSPLDIFNAFVRSVVLLVLVPTCPYVSHPNTTGDKAFLLSQENTSLRG